MGIMTLLIVSAGTWTLTRWLLMPWVKRSLDGSRTSKRLALAGLSAGLDQLVKLASVAIVTSLFLVVVNALSLWGGVSGIVELVGTFKGVQEVLSVIGDWTQAWTFIILLTTIILLSFWRGRKDYREQINSYVSHEFERLQEQREARPETWEDLPPTEDIKAINQLVDGVSDQARELGQREDLDEDTRQKANQFLAARLKELVNARAVLDYERRIDFSKLDLQPDDAENPTSGRRILQFLFSAGMYKDTKRVTKLTSRLALAFTITALIGIQSDGLSEGLNRSINMLVVKASKDQAAESWAVNKDKGVKTPEPNRTQSAEDAQLARHLAQHFLNSLSRSRVWSLPAEQPFLAEAAHRQSVRRAILSGEAAALQKTETGIAEGIFQASSANHKRLEEALTGEIIRASEQQPARWNKLRGNLKAHAALYKNMVPVGEAHSEILKEVIGAAFDVFKIDPKTEVGKFATKIIADVGQDTVAEISRAHLHRTLLSLERGEDLNAVLLRVRMSNDAILPNQVRLRPATRAALLSEMPEEQMIMRLHQHPPVAATKVEAHAGLDDASSTAKRILNLRAPSLEPGETRSAMDALAEFNDHFPGQLGAEERTPLGKLATELEHSRPVSSAPSLNLPDFKGRGTPRASSTSFARARSFGRLRGFFRVGGVLIGRPPVNAGEKTKLKILPFSDLLWQVEGSNITLSLRATNGKDVTVGTFPASIVNRALHYAADGRPTTVTMASAQPLMELKILLHPALVDTEIGCMAISLDRLVDTYARKDLVLQNAEQRIYLESALYRYGWYIRQKKALENIGDEDAKKIVGRVLRHLSELQSDAERALQERSLFAVAANSLLLTKPEFFDSNLLTRIVEAHSRTTRLQDFVQALGTWNLSATNGTQSDSRKRRWFDEPTRFEVWSGVREAPYELDNSLSFLRSSSNQPLWPFEFILQTAFTTPPFASDNNEVGVDEKPFEFTLQVKETIKKRIVENMLREENTLTHMHKFAILQRLFRIALDDHFVPHFPLEKLAALERATQPYVLRSRTQRWNFRPGLLEHQFKSLLGVATKIMPDASVRACSALLETSKDPTSIPQSNWSERCGFRSQVETLTQQCSKNGNASSCQQSNLLGSLAMLTEARLLRQQLGVGRDEAQLRSGLTCGGL